MCKNTSLISFPCNFRSLESPSNSLETVTGGGVKSDSVNNSTSAPQWDSDAEAEPDPPDWTKNVPEDVLRSLSPREKKRQEVINGNHSHLFLPFSKKNVSENFGEKVCSLL